jgi:FkbM family methyltransferase
LNSYYHEPNSLEKIANKLLHPIHALRGRKHRVYEGDLSFVRWLDQIGVFTQCSATIDVGANVGTFSSAIAIVKPGHPIYAIEPGAEAYNHLLQKAGIFKQIRPFRLGFGANAANLELRVGTLTEANSFLSVSQQHVEAWPESRQTKSESINVERFDEWAKNNKIFEPLFVKIDVQGFEAAVISGFGAHADFIQFLLVEFQLDDLYEGGASPPALLEKIEVMGFKIHGVPRYVYANKSHSSPLFADFLFCRRVS